MPLVWNPWALPNLVAGVVILTMGFFVLHVGQGRLTNRLLSGVFILYGVAITLNGILFSSSDPRDALALQIAFTPAFVGAILLYPCFIGEALRRGAPGFLRSRAWLVLMLAAIGIATIAIIARPDLVAPEVRPQSYAPYDAVPGPLLIGMLVGSMTISLAAIAMSIAEFVRSPRGTPARRRAAFFLTAFSVQDVFIAATALTIIVTGPGSIGFSIANVAGYSVAIACTSLLVGYGMLRYQLFDIDVKIKLGMKRTTVAAVFLAVVFVVGQLVQAFAGLVFGTIAGAVAAGLLLFALAPLQRMAERVSDAAMPRVRDTEEYRTVRKHEVYLAAVESAMGDGELTEKERNVLATLADQLGLGVKETLELERRVRPAERSVPSGRAPAPP